MKYIPMIIVVLLLAAGCALPGTLENSTIPQLTPYFTATGGAATLPPAATAVAETAVPTPVPTPQIHIVGLGETITSIAIQYGVSIDALLQANPEIDPRVMIVGDEVRVPAKDTADHTGKLDSVTDQILFGPAYCTQSGGGLWCSVMMENASQFSLAFPVVSFAFIDVSGTLMEETRAPGVLQKFAAGMKMPAVIFLDEVPEGYTFVETSLFSISDSSDPANVISVNVENESVSISGMSAVISGEMLAAGENADDRADVRLVAAALNESGVVIGVRRKDLTVALNERFDFTVTVYSTGGNIEEVILFKEAH